MLGLSHFRCRELRSLAFSMLGGPNSLHQMALTEFPYLFLCDIFSVRSGGRRGKFGVDSDGQVDLLKPTLTSLEFFLLFCYSPPFVEFFFFSPLWHFSLGLSSFLLVWATHLLRVQPPLPWLALFFELYFKISLQDALFFFFFFADCSMCCLSLYFLA